MEPIEPSPSDEYEDDEDREHEATAGPRGKTGLGPLPRWQKVLLGMAGLFVLVGLGLQGFALTRGEGSPAGGEAGVAERQAIDSPDSALVTQSQQGDGPGVVVVAPGDDAGEADGAGSAEDWSPFFFKGGFGFFAGFCIGYALRVFFRVSTVAVGFLLLTLVGLAYAGIIDIRWDVMGDYYDRLIDVVKDESGHFQTFVAGTVPATAFSAVGLFTGFKRR